ncbi:hypothetical protein ACXWRW_11725, partial [Streptococcus pyogenes]
PPFSSPPFFFFSSLPLSPLSLPSLPLFPPLFSFLSPPLFPLFSLLFFFSSLSFPFFLFFFLPPPLFPFSLPFFPLLSL